MVLVESRRLVKLSARLSRRGVQGVDTGVERRLLLDITQEASDGPDKRLGVTRVSSSEGCRILQVVKVYVELL